jgi:hypothetical protein
MSEEQPKTKTWGDWLDEVKVTEQRLAKFSKDALAREYAVTLHCYSISVDEAVESLEKGEELAKLIRSGRRVKKIVEALDRGDYKSLKHLRRSRRARR